MKKGLTLFFIVVGCLLIGCQTGTQGGRTYSTGQAQRALNVYSGTVLKVSDVQIKSDQSPAGAIGGAVVGGIIGSTIGGGRGTTLATTAGAVGGAAAGNAVEGAMRTKAALELEIEVDDGRIVVIVQEKDDEFMVGDRVRLIESSDGTLRVRQ